MELILFRHAEYERLYNCTGFDIEVIPIEKRRFVPEAIVGIVLCAVFYILYIPCLISIWKHVAENTCYKLLFFIGIMDVSILWILGFFHGWLSLTGAVFCSHPTLIYVAGVAAMAGWIIESCADMLLAIDRCLEIIAPKITDMLFRGARIHVWLGVCCIYAVYWIFFEKPLLFNGIYFAWFFNPYAGYREDPDGIYKVKLHGIHDYCIAILMPLIYLAFFLCFQYKFRHQNISPAQKMGFLQVLVFSAMNTMAPLIYVTMQYVAPIQGMITFAQFIWFFIHGFPPVVYLLLNKTIRSDCTKMLFKVISPNRVTHVHGVTVLVRRAPANQATTGT